MKPEFHDIATISGYLGTDFVAAPIHLVYDYVDGNEAATKLNARLTSSDIAGTIASTRLEMDN